MYGFISPLFANYHRSKFICSAANVAGGRLGIRLQLKNEVSNCIPKYLAFVLLVIWNWNSLDMIKNRKYLTNRKFDLAQNKHAKLYPNCDVSVWTRSCEEEITTPIVGKMRGTIPKWLNGSLLRNGPGSMKVNEMQFEHLFDSLALLHKYVRSVKSVYRVVLSINGVIVCPFHRFDILNGEVTYQCRFIQSDSYKKNMAANRIVVNSYGTKVVPDPCHTIFQRISSVFTEDVGTDNANISIYPMGDEFYAFTECPIIQRWVCDRPTTDYSLMREICD